MKINLILEIEGDKRALVIHCGNGEKSFKWLGLVATQRFALAAPVGTSRCRESVRGSSEHAQHHPVRVRLSSGDCPIPSSMLSEFLHDGDTVYVELDNGREVNSVGYAQSSSWFDEAFKNSDYDSGAREASEAASDELQAVDPFGDSAACKVMRNLLRTQVLDEDKIASLLMDEWPLVKHSVPRLTDSDNVMLKNMCRRYYCFLLELFKHYAALTSSMDLENFSTLVVDANIFGVSSLSRSSVVFKRVTSARGVASMDFSCFLAALIICSQQLHVNTLDKDGCVRNSSEALYAVVRDMLMPLIYRLQLNHVTKDIFCSTAFFDKLRGFHDDLVLVFEKTAARSGTEPPVVLHIEHMADLLVELKFLKDSDSHRIEILNSMLLASRAGILKGEPYLRNPSITTDSVDKQRSQNLRRPEVYDFPENIITYPEFVEVCARAGALKFAKGLLESDLSVPQKLIEYTEAMERSVTMVANLNRKRPPTPTKQHSRVAPR